MAEEKYKKQQEDLKLKNELFKKSLDEHVNMKKSLAMKEKEEDCKHVNLVNEDVMKFRQEEVLKGERERNKYFEEKRIRENQILECRNRKLEEKNEARRQEQENSKAVMEQIENEKNYTHKPTRAELEGEFEDEIHYYASRDKFKALKRLFSLLQIEGEKGVRLENLVTFFNGEVGYLNKIKNELKILEALLVQDFRPVPFRDIYNNLQVIKEQIANVYQIKLDDKLFKMIDEITANNALDGIKCLIDYFQKKINLNSKDFLKMYI